MKSSVLIVGIVLTGFLNLSAQDYKPTTAQNDSFSIALVKLLNSAIIGFDDCKGEHLQYTRMQDNEYRLTIDFPGATAGIVRVRETWDKNAYIEFRGYADKNAVEKGMKALAEKIRHTLGDQLNLDHPLLSGGDSSWFFLWSMGIRNNRGFFEPNIELMTTTSRSPSYLLEKDGIKQDDSLKKEHVILLKVQRGVPAYYNYIFPGESTPEPILTNQVSELIKSAGEDFQSLRKVKDGLKPVKKDTLYKNGFKVHMNYSGQNYSANIFFTMPADTIVFDNHWKRYQQVLKATLGADYVYYFYDQQNPSILYFRKDYKENQPVCYLETINTGPNSPGILLRIESRFFHATKRSRSLDD